MISFKNKLFALVLILTISCDNSKNIDAPENEQRSTFVISKISGESEISELNQFEVPTKRLYNFEACLRDNLHNKNINNQKFSIHGENGEITQRMSNESGCIYWSEEITFNFFEDSRYLKLNRSLRSEGIHKGSYSVPLAVNPWLHGERLDEVVDLRKGSVVVLLDERNTREVLTRETTDSSKPIYVSDLSLKLTEAKYQKDMLFYQVELTTSPKVLLNNTKGQLVEVDIKGGEYNLEFFLIHETIKDQTRSRSVLSDPVKFSAKNFQGKIEGKFLFGMDKIPTDGFYRALLKITPIDGENDGLVSGEVVFDLGEAGAITGSKSGKLLAEVVEARGNYKALNFIDVNQKNTAHFDEGFLPTGIYVKENLKLSFKKFDNETTTERDVIFDVTACLGRKDGKSIGLRNIEVHKIRRELDQNTGRLPLVDSEQFTRSERVTTKINLQTSQCLTWEDSFRHKYFVPERKAIVSFILKNEDIGLNEEVDVMINPWDFGWTFGRDARIQEEEAKLRESEETRPASKFFLRNYRFIEQGTSYKIDKFMNLHQVAHMRFSLDPKVERPSSQTKGINQVEDLRKGPYLLRILIRRNDVEDQDAVHEYIAHAQTIATVTKGSMTADLDLVLSEQELFRSRNRILIEFATVDENKIEPINATHFKPKDGETYESVIDYSSGLKPAIFEGPVILSSSSGANRVEPFTIKNLSRLKETMNRRFNPTFPDNYVEKLIDNVSDEYVTLKSLIDLGEVKKAADREFHQRLVNDYVKFNNYQPIYLENQDVRSDFLTTLRDLERKYPYKSTRAREHQNDILDKFLDDPHGQSKFQESLCYYFLNEMIYNHEYEGKRLGDILGRSRRSSFMMNCINWTKAPLFDRWMHNDEGINDTPILKRLGSIIKPSFNFTRIYMPDHVEQIHHEGGIPYSYGIKTGYSLSRSYGWKTSFSFGGKSPTIGGIFGLSGGTGPGWGWSRGSSTGTGFGLSLDIEENIELVKMSKTRQCLSVRLSPHLINSSLLRPTRKSLSGDESLDEYIEGLIRTKGLLFCSAKQDKPIEKIEYYYYMEQKKGPGILQDPTDIRNRQIKIKIRGRNEFYTFIKNFEGELKTPENIFATTEPEMFGRVYLYMKDNVNSVPASYPGVYVDLNESSDIYRSFYAR